MTDLDRLLELARKRVAATTKSQGDRDARGAWAKFTVTLQPDTIIGLIERVKEAEREVESLKQFVPMSAIEAARAKDLEARLRAVEGKLALAEEVVEAARQSGTWAPTEIVMALRRYDEATKE